MDTNENLAVSLDGDDGDFGIGTGGVKAGSSSVGIERRFAGAKGLAREEFPAEEDSSLGNQAPGQDGSVGKEAVGEWCPRRRCQEGDRSASHPNKSALRLSNTSFAIRLKCQGHNRTICGGPRDECRIQ